MKFFSKLKDYNNLLEEILDQKTFSSIAKSLLLSMIYKLEISYKDYAIVKVDSVSKDVFLRNILEVIKNYCDHIKIVEPDSSQATLLIKNNVNTLTNTKERSILAYPTELAMLEAIANIEPKYFFIRKDFEQRQQFQNLLVEGYKQNTIEVLKNFNGWSWDINVHEKMNYVANIVYQNIMMIKGEQFLTYWRCDDHGKKDYLLELRKTIKSITGNEKYFETLNNLLKGLKEAPNYEKVEEELIKLQKLFLKIIEKKVEMINLREEIIKMLYQLRLFQNLVFSEGMLVKDCKQIANVFEHTQKLLLTKACKLGIIKIVSMDIQTNFDILKNVFDTKIIDLEQIKIYLELEKENIMFKVYDKEVFEKQVQIKWNGNKKDIIIRKKKKINIFN